MLGLVKASYFMCNFAEAEEHVNRALESGIQEADVLAECYIMYALILDALDKEPDNKYKNLQFAYKST